MAAGSPLLRDCGKNKQIQSGNYTASPGAAVQPHYGTTNPACLVTAPVPEPAVTKTLNAGKCCGMLPRLNPFIGDRAAICSPVPFCAAHVNGCCCGVCERLCFAWLAWLGWIAFLALGFSAIVALEMIGVLPNRFTIKVAQILYRWGLL